MHAILNRVEEKDGIIRPIRIEEQLNPKLLPKGAKVFLGGPLTSQTPSATTTYDLSIMEKYINQEIGDGVQILKG